MTTQKNNDKYVGMIKVAKPLDREIIQLYNLNVSLFTFMCFDKYTPFDNLKNDSLFKKTNLFLKNDSFLKDTNLCFKNNYFIKETNLSKMIPSLKRQTSLSER